MLNIEQFLVQQKYFYFLAYFVKMTHFLQDLVQTRKHNPYLANLVESPKHCVVMKRRTMPKK